MFSSKLRVLRIISGDGGISGSKEGISSSPKPDGPFGIAGRKPASLLVNSSSRWESGAAPLWLGSGGGAPALASAYLRAPPVLLAVQLRPSLPEFWEASAQAAASSVVFVGVADAISTPATPDDRFLAITFRPGVACSDSPRLPRSLEEAGGRLRLDAASPSGWRSS